MNNEDLLKLIDNCDEPVKNLITYLNSITSLSEAFVSNIIPMLKTGKTARPLKVASTGKKFQTAYWMDKGGARYYVIKHDKYGIPYESTTYIFGKGKILFDSECFFYDALSRYHIEICRDSVYVEFSRESFLLLAGVAPEAVELASRLKGLQSDDRMSLIEVIRLPPKKKITGFIERKGEHVMIHQRKRDVINFLSVSESTFNINKNGPSKKKTNAVKKKTSRRKSIRTRKN
ncbi:hypothetical protein [Pedobacter sp. JY14-1]|uniref:hypothetical protein n=1 Tax=Pedobacter sp. JY14-1 TaxID=3034151 RepID=UPI0023E19A7B|nr:hypothetical protein [Pedobacter sp. JY14-1]